MNFNFDKELNYYTFIAIFSYITSTLIVQSTTEFIYLVDFSFHIVTIMLSSVMDSLYTYATI